MTAFRRDPKAGKDQSEGSTAASHRARSGAYQGSQQNSGKIER